MIMYSWTALSGNTSEAVVGMGITRDREKARLDAEEPIRSGRAFVAIIESVRPVIAAHSLSPCYLRTGAAWIGRRDNSGGVAWRRFFVNEDEADRIDS
jgi:hypothetical protein